MLLAVRLDPGEIGKVEDGPGVEFKVGNVKGRARSSCDPGDLTENNADVEGEVTWEEEAEESEVKSGMETGAGMGRDIGIDPEPRDFDRNRGGLRYVASGSALEPAPSQSQGPGDFCIERTVGELTELPMGFDGACGWTG